MSKEQLREILSSLYYRGVHDGIDIQRTPEDKFNGNREARIEWEKETIENSLSKILEEPNE